MNAPLLYRDVVLDHYRHPRNRGALAAHTHAADGVNPLCGDVLRVEVACADDGRIVDMRFSGEACAITTATASMLSGLVVGLDAGAVGALSMPFERMLRGDVDGDDALGPMNSLVELRRHPMRRKCAELPWATLRSALGRVERVSTEGR
jgi:nitrogen fixation protein NifU and related proteins